MSNWLLRVFGIKPPPPDPPDPLHEWQCPTCGHRTTVGVFRLGRVIPDEVLLREQYENDQINSETFVRLLLGERKQ